MKKKHRQSFLKNFPRGDDELSLNQVECGVLVLTLHCTCHGEKKGEDGKTQYYINNPGQLPKKNKTNIVRFYFEILLIKEKRRRKSLS